MMNHLKIQQNIQQTLEQAQQQEQNYQQIEVSAFNFS